MKKSFKDMLNSVAEKLKTVPDKLKVIPEKLKVIPEKVSALLKKQKSSVQQEKAAPKETKVLPEKLQAVLDKFKVLLNKIKRFFESLKDKLKQIENANQSKKASKKQDDDSADKIDWDYVWYGCREVFRWIYRLRSILLAIPVMVASVALAVYSNSRLPDFVGLNMQATGEYATVISRSVAVMGPLALTAICLLMMFCSKKVLYPWLISLFSLVLPLIFLFTSTFP